MTDRVEVGDRVRSNEAPHEGEVHEILVEYTAQGPVPILRIFIDMQGGQEIPPHPVESVASLWTRVPPTEEAELHDGTCSCGGYHGPFSPIVRGLFVNYQQAVGLDEREDCLAELARGFASESEPSDLNVTEATHAIIAEVDAAHLKAHQALLKLGRMIVRDIEDMNAEEMGLSDHDPEPARGPRRIVTPRSISDAEKKSRLN